MEMLIIRAGSIENVILLHDEDAPDFTPPEGTQAHPQSHPPAAVGWAWVHGAPVAPPVPEPTAQPPAFAAELTHGQFRALLTDTEQLILDNFSIPEFAAEVPAIQALTVMQRAQVRTGIKTYNDVTSVSLADPRTVRFISLMAAFGLLDSPARADRILAGVSPEVAP